jgi:hypothetical protein
MSSLRIAQILGVYELSTFEEIWGMSGLIIQMQGGFDESI